MTKANGKRGRPRKYREFDELYDSCPLEMRRPLYCKRIGVRRGKRGDTIWIKVQLPDGGTWKGRTYLPGLAAEIKLGRKSSVTWEEAVSQLNSLQDRADNNMPLEDDPIPLFKDWAVDWLKRKQATAKRPDTIKVHLDVHLVPTFGATRIDRIKPSDIERWVAKSIERELSPSYVKRMVNTLKSILYDALREGHLTENPATKISPITGLQARQRFLDPAEIVLLLIEAEKVEPWLSDIIIFALHSGMRRGELQSMQWNNIGTLPDGGKVVLLESTKSGKPRSIICTKSMIEVLDRQVDRRVVGDDRVFPISKMTWRRRWEKARKNANLDDIDFHDLRRTNATQAAASGVDLRTLAARIGHTDLAMLEKHYAMVVGSAQHEAAGKIQDTFDRLTSNVVPMKPGS
ncbi:MAG: site-specific integrase [Bacteroidetes Order II. Incertae sedis bacterium]|jgi:integrase|nr:site-specific integrase [Bacteroidetes Order II. bacterium]